MSDPTRRRGHPPDETAGGYETTVPPPDEQGEPRRTDRPELAGVAVDPEEVVKGGPRRSPGAVTTTGGVAGPAMRHATGQLGRGKVAPTTTGDATSGGMDAPTSGTTSDASSGGLPAQEGKGGRSPRAPARRRRR